MQDIEEKFWLNVTITPTCWLWSGNLNFKVNNNRTIQAAKAAYVWTYGQIRDGRDVRVTCKTRNCVNPAHLKTVKKAPTIS